jgi:hypothetical protein
LEQPLAWTENTHPPSKETTMRSPSSGTGLTVAVVLIATLARANEASFSFKMEHECVDGQKNGVEHSLSHGVLTINGELWLTNCVVGSTGPNTVTITIFKDGIIDGEVCSFDVTPSKPVGRKVSFSTTCVTVPASDLYVVVIKTDDGCDVEGTGVLKT